MEKEIIEKLADKGLSEKSIKLYLTILKNLNDKREILNFKFLEKPKKVLDKIKDYKLTTKRNVIIAIVSILKNLGNELYKSYYDIMIEMNKKIENDTKDNKKTLQQKENWIEWSDVIKKFEELKKNIVLSKNISETQYNNLLDAVILGLYVLIPPRRSKDFLLMKVSKDGKNLDPKFNWLDMKKKQFIFNNYKTSKTYGEQIVNIPDELFLILKKYLKVKKESTGFLLVKFNEKNLKSDNAITRILNKIFDKKIASSMLRHIYLSSKYGKINQEQTEDAKLMGHSILQQKEYIKT